MRILAAKMKSCFTCRFADAFIVPNKCHFDLNELEVECAVDALEDREIQIGDDCFHYELYCTPKTTLKD